jgi:hypothetical protein
MLQHSNGTMNGHAVNGHVLINGKEHGSKSGVRVASPEASIRIPDPSGLASEAVKRPARKSAVKATTKAKTRKVVRQFGRLYALPSLLVGCAEKSAADLETYCRLAIAAAWKADNWPHGGGTKAAREEIARWHFTPADIAAVAHLLADYNYRPWPHGEAADQKIEWLSVGFGCCERFGTARDAHLAAWRALEAALSILADVPLECSEDAEAFLLLLINTGWRHLPPHQQGRVAQRMGRYVSDRITGQHLPRGRTY